MFMRALLAGEHTPVRAVEPVRCFCCGCRYRDRPLYRFTQLMREEWLACEPCGRSGGAPGVDGKPVRPRLHRGTPLACLPVKSD